MDSQGRGITAAGMLVILAGYGIGSWGWILVRGWDITAGNWFSVTHPYQWPVPPQQPAPASPTSVLPTGQQQASQSAAFTAGGVVAGLAPKLLGAARARRKAAG